MENNSSRISRQIPSLCGLNVNRLSDEVFELHKPRTGPITIQIVFVHGLQADGTEEHAHLRTWMKRDGSGCWLNTWLVESFPQAHILSVAYDSHIETSASTGRLDMYLIGENLAHSLVYLAGVGQTCPVLLVGHCVGGLVLKEICIRASRLAMRDSESTCSRYRTFLTYVRGAFFYSTAHSGSHMTVRSTLKEDSRGPLLDFMDLLNKHAGRINSEFAQLRHLYGWKTSGVIEANETSALTLASHLGNVKRRRLECGSTSKSLALVPEASARQDVDHFMTIGGADHFSVSKPMDEKSNNFLFLVHFLHKIVEDEDRAADDLRLYLQLPHTLLRVEGRLKHVIELLDLQNPKPIRLALVGLEGLGKSTLAKQILLEVRRNFQYICFLDLEDVHRPLKTKAFITMVAENLYTGIGRKVLLKGEAPWSLLKGKRVLMVVDDVQSKDEVHPLLNSDWCGDGSRLIITSWIQGWMPPFVEHKVALLSSEDSEELFRSHLGAHVLQAIPPGLVSEVVGECDGLPITLNVLGSYLSNNVNTDVSQWRNALGRLRTANSLDGVGCNKVWRKLQVVFDQLNPPEQRIFLDLATFDLYGRQKVRYDCSVLKAAWEEGLKLDSSSFGEVIHNLQNLSFLRTVPDSWNPSIVEGPLLRRFTFYIHKVLRDMGKWIYRPENATLQSCRGLCEYEAVKCLLLDSKVETSDYKKLEVMSIAMDPELKEQSFKAPETSQWSSMNKLESLRLLRMSNIHTAQDLTFPKSLKMLHMVNCSRPQKKWWSPSWWRDCWPIREENVEILGRLSVLLLENCRHVVLPENVHKLTNLRILWIHDEGADIMLLPESFGLLPALEQLTLSAPLEKLPATLLELKSLRSMALRRCFNLRAWPIPRKVGVSLHLNCLTHLELVDLPALEELPDTFGEMSSLQELKFQQCSSLQRLPEGFGKLRQLTLLTVKGCGRLESLGESFHNLQNLVKLWLEDLYALQELPNRFGELPSLQNLYLEKCTALREMPSSFVALHNLTIDDCGRLESFSDDREHRDIHCKLRRLKSLEVLGCPRLHSLPASLGLCSELEEIRVQRCAKLTGVPWSITEISTLRDLVIEGLHADAQGPNLSCSISSLTRFTIDNCPHLKCLPESIGQLTSLKHLTFSSCENLQSLPECIGQLTLLTELYMTHCDKLVNLPASIGQLTSLTEFRIIRCQSLAFLPESICNLPSLNNLTISQCASLLHLPTSIGDLKSLTHLNISHCDRLIYFLESISQFTSLNNLTLDGFQSFEHLPESIGQLTSLKKFTVDGFQCLEHLPESIGQLTSLNELTLRGFQSLVDLPESIGQLTSLNILTLFRFQSLVHLPESIGQLTSLNKLTLRGFQSLVQLPESIGQLTSLNKLTLRGFQSLVQLPESIGQLTSLNELTLDGFQSLVHLPESIGQLTSLTNLSIGNCTCLLHLPESLGRLTNLRELHVPDVRNQKSLPHSLPQLKKLEKLELRSSGGPNIKGIPESLQELPDLRRLSIHGCENFEGLFESLGQLRSLSDLSIRSCQHSRSVHAAFRQLTRPSATVRTLLIEDCHSLRELPNCLGQLKALNVFEITNCDNLEGLPESIGQLPDLYTLDIHNCRGLRELPKSVGYISSLFRLSIRVCENLKTLPESVGHFQAGALLSIQNCDSFECVPQSVELRSALGLVRLAVYNCKNFKR